MANDRRASRRDIWAVIPVKETAVAKQRLAEALSPGCGSDLALAMFQDVLERLQPCPSCKVSLSSRWTAALPRSRDVSAPKFGPMARSTVIPAQSRRRHVRLAANSSTMLTIPGDVPLVTAADISSVLAAHAAAPAFTIVPAWDEHGSNTIVCSPADAVPLRFGPDSYFPHLAAARACGLAPTIVHNGAIALDIDEPADLTKFMEQAFRHPQLQAARRMPRRVGSQFRGP